MNMEKSEQDAFAIVVNESAVGNIQFERGKDVERFGVSHQSAIKEGKLVDMPYYVLLKHPALPYVFLPK